MKTKLKSVLIFAPNHEMEQIISESLSGENATVEVLSSPIGVMSKLSESGSLKHEIESFLFIDLDQIELDNEEIILFAANLSHVAIVGVSGEKNKGPIDFIPTILRRPLEKSDLKKVFHSEKKEVMLLDRAVLQSLVDLGGDDDQFFKKIVDIFLSRGPALILEMKQALNEKDFFKLERSAHSLKGSSGNIGALQMWELCKAVEMQAKAHDNLGIWEILEKLEENFQLMEKVLKEDWLQQAS